MSNQMFNSQKMSFLLAAGKLVTVVFLATFVIASGFFALWHAYIKAPLDLWWIWDSRDEALQTMGRYSGDLSTTCLLVLVLWLLFCRLFWHLSVKAIALLIAVTFIGQLTLLSLGYAVSPFTEIVRVARSFGLRAQAEILLMPLMREPGAEKGHTRPAVDPGESVLVIQLESANGLILQLPQDEEYAERLRLQHLEVFDRWSSRGLVIKQLWETGVQTNRGYESFYCGIARNIGGAFSFKSTMPQPCVPQILSNHGYRTIFVNNYHDPKFQNFGAFAKAMGFESYVDSDELVGKHLSDDWGEDECVFSESALRYFDKHVDRNSKYFLNVKFSPNHVPFCRADMDCSRFSPEARYLHSSIRQLQCAELFEQKMRTLFTERQKSLHVIVLSDTSWPLGLSDFSSKFNERGISTDGFLSYAAILPATAAPVKTANVIGQIQGPLSQLDIGPTILDLTGIRDANLGNSLLPLVRQGSLSSSYEHCHMLSQPFGDIEFAVLKPGQLDVYNLNQNSYQTRFLSEGMFESRVHVSVPVELPDDIKSASFCRRFIKGPTSGAP